MTLHMEIPQLLPVLDDATERALRESIARFGVLVPTIVDEHGRLLDGHHRVRIARELGMPVPERAVRLDSDEDSLEVAAHLNTARRQMSPEQRHQVVIALREAGHSIRAIAAATGASKSQVDRDVDQLSRAGQLEPPERVERGNGGSYPAQRPADADEPRPEPLAVWPGDDEATDPLDGAEYPSRLAVHFSSGNDVWSTPQDFFDYLAAEFAFETDVCCLPESAKCGRYFTPEDDGLAQEWTGVCWMNPPYSEMAPWVKKAHESAQAGATVVALIPARTDTAWWWDYCRHHEIRFVKGRLKFGGSPNSAPFPSAVVVFGAPPRTVWRDHRNTNQTMEAHDVYAA